MFPLYNRKDLAIRVFQWMTAEDIVFRKTLLHSVLSKQKSPLLGRAWGVPLGPRNIFHNEASFGSEYTSYIFSCTIRVHVLQLSSCDELITVWSWPTHHVNKNAWCVFQTFQVHLRNQHTGYLRNRCHIDYSTLIYFFDLALQLSRFGSKRKLIGWCFTLMW